MSGGVCERRRKGEKYTPCKKEGALDDLLKHQSCGAVRFRSFVLLAPTASFVGDLACLDVFVDCMSYGKKALE